jgi:hypothetical protein
MTGKIRYRSDVLQGTFSLGGKRKAGKNILLRQFGEVGDNIVKG